MVARPQMAFRVVDVPPFVGFKGEQDLRKLRHYSAVGNKEPPNHRKRKRNDRLYRLAATVCSNKDACTDFREVPARPKKGKKGATSL